MIPVFIPSWNSWLAPLLWGNPCKAYSSARPAAAPCASWRGRPCPPPVPCSEHCCKCKRSRRKRRMQERNLHSYTNVRCICNGSVRILSQQCLTEVRGGHEHQVRQKEVIQQHFWKTGNVPLSNFHWSLCWRVWRAMLLCFCAIMPINANLMTCISWT